MIGSEAYLVWQDSALNFSLIGFLEFNQFCYVMCNTRREHEAQKMQKRCKYTQLLSTMTPFSPTEQSPACSLLEMTDIIIMTLHYGSGWRPVIKLKCNTKIFRRKNINNFQTRLAFIHVCWQSHSRKLANRPLENFYYSKSHLKFYYIELLSTIKPKTIRSKTLNIFIIFM